MSIDGFWSCLRGVLVEGRDEPPYSVRGALQHLPHSSMKAFSASHPKSCATLKSMKQLSRVLGLAVAATGLLMISSVSFAQGASKKPLQTAKKPAPMTHKITADAAKKIALAKFKGTVTKAPLLEKEDGKWQWEVIVVNGKTMTEVNVDADSGKITSSEKVTEKEEAKEKAKKKGKG